MKRFIIGFWIVLFIILLYIVPVVIYNTSLDVFNNLLCPIFVYVSIFFAGKITKNIYSRKLFYFTKYFGSLFFIIITLSIAEWNNIETMLPLIVSISALCNWNIKEEKNPVQKKSEEEKSETKSNIIFPYLINFITLFIVYIIASMCYFSMETGEKGIWFLIIIMGIAFALVYWLSYLCYRYLLRNTKTTKIIKVVMILILLYWVYYFGSTIKQMPFHLLIAFVMAAFISLTVQNLILTWNKKTNTE